MDTHGYLVPGRGMGMGGFSYPRSGLGSGMGAGLCSWVRVWGVNPR
jgi:hypothetical protein